LLAIIAIADERCVNETIRKSFGSGSDQFDANVVFYHHSRKTANIIVNSLNSLNLVLRTPNDTSETANIKIVSLTNHLPGCL
jgi:hypothetical protein